MKTFGRILNHFSIDNSHFAASLLTGLCACLVVAESSMAGVPGLISYQGRLTNSSGAPVPDGT